MSPQADVYNYSMRRPILLVLTLVCIACAARQPSPQIESGPVRQRSLRFDSELVRLRLDGSDSLEVEGLYRFECAPTAPPQSSLLYPFPREDMGGARVLDCEFRREDEAWQVAAYDTASYLNGILWRMPLNGARHCEVRIRYRQELLGPSARYIVTTTQGWEEPLRHARFEAFVAPELGAPSFNHPFAPCDSLGPGAFSFEATEFWPEEDIVVNW